MTGRVTPLPSGSGGTFKLDFVVVGPERTGTTWLYAHLRRHPALQLTERTKETFWFDRYPDRSAEWYVGAFLPEGVRPGALAGEVSPTYFHQPPVRDRLFSHNPDCRIIISLREPVSRAYSHFLHLRRLGWVPRTAGLAEAIRLRPEILEGSRYATHLRGWADRFPAAQVSVLRYEQLASDPAAFAAGACSALGVAPRPLEPGETERVFESRADAPRPGARLARRTVEVLRARGLYRVIEAGKRVGLDRFLQSGSGAPPPLGDDDRRILEDCIGEEGGPWAALAGHG